MDKNFRILIGALRTQEKNYKDLLKVSSDIDNLLSLEKWNKDTVDTLLNEREELFKKTKTADDEIGSILQKAENRDSLLDEDEAKDIIEQLKKFIGNMAEADKSIQKKLTADKGNTGKEFGSLTRARRSMAGYDLSSKPAYAKFVDIKR